MLLRKKLSALYSPEGYMIDHPGTLKSINLRDVALSPFHRIRSLPIFCPLNIFSRENGCHSEAFIWRAMTVEAEKAT
jgi:hypothetical protein